MRKTRILSVRLPHKNGCYHVKADDYRYQAMDWIIHISPCCERNAQICFVILIMIVSHPMIRSTGNIKARLNYCITSLIGLTGYP
jgi:hypothetical protein